MVEEAGAAALDGAGLVRPAASDASQQFSEFLRRALIQLHTIELARLHGDFSDRITDTFLRCAAADQLQTNKPGAVPAGRAEGRREGKGGGRRGKNRGWE